MGLTEKPRENRPRGLGFRKPRGNNGSSVHRGRMAEVWRPVSHRRLRPLGHGSPTWPLPRPPRGSLSRPGPPRQASCATERPLTRQFTSGLGLLHLERPTCHVPGTQLRPPAAQAARPRPSQSVCPHTDARPPPLTSVLGPGSRSPPSRCPFLGRTQGLKSIPTESHFNQQGVPRSTHVAPAPLRSGEQVRSETRTPG